MTFGVVVFPGSNCDADTLYALREVLGAPAVPLWHGEDSLGDGQSPPVECVILPGGFAHGDYLRAGAIARFAPVMRAVRRHADAGGLVLGICNGFQVLVEAGLLPGALLRNAALEFRCQWVSLRVDRCDTPFTSAYRRGEVVRMPVAHGEGRYYADAATLARLEANGQVVLRYYPAPKPENSPHADEGNHLWPTHDRAHAADAEYNPNGSVHDIAGIVNERGNVLGLMPHPERCCEALLDGAAGLRLFQSVTHAISGAGIR